MAGAQRAFDERQAAGEAVRQAGHVDLVDAAGEGQGAAFVAVLAQPFAPVEALLGDAGVDDDQGVVG